MQRVKLWAMDQFLCSPSAYALTCPTCGQRRPGLFAISGNLCFPPHWPRRQPCEHAKPWQPQEPQSLGCVAINARCVLPLHSSCLTDDASAHTGTSLDPEVSCLRVSMCWELPGDMKLNCRRISWIPEGPRREVALGHGKVRPGANEAAPGEAENNAQPQEKVPSDRALLA